MGEARKWPAPIQKLLLPIGEAVLVGLLLVLKAYRYFTVPWGASAFAGRELLIVGKYSLLAYIVQIAVLQVLTRLIGRLDPFTVPFYLQMAGVGLLMILMAEGLQWARSRAGWVDASYRFIFA